MQKHQITTCGLIDWSHAKRSSSRWQGPLNLGWTLTVSHLHLSLLWSLALGLEKNTSKREGNIRKEQYIVYNHMKK